MTAIAEELQAWQHQPGWGIKAELMPPEVLADRRTKIVRRIVILALAVLLVLCGLGYSASVYAGHSANDALKAQDRRQSDLQATHNSFDKVIAVQSSIAQLKTQIASLLGSDAKVESVLQSVVSAAPKGLLFNQITLNINSVAASSNAVGGAALDTGTVRHIGTLTITATARALPDVATYLDSLAAVPGFIKPFPGPVTVTGTNTQFSVQFDLGDSLLTHNYDAKAGTN
jgi:hypothetical protein